MINSQNMDEIWINLV